MVIPYFTDYRKIKIFKKPKIPIVLRSSSPFIFCFSIESFIYTVIFFYYTKYSLSISLPQAEKTIERDLGSDSLHLSFFLGLSTGLPFQKGSLRFALILYVFLSFVVSLCFSLLFLPGFNLSLHLLICFILVSVWLIVFGSSVSIWIWGLLLYDGLF